MDHQEIRKRFLDFFEKRGHKVIPSASLVPENDSSVLFTTAGMQQFKPYYIGKADALKDFGSLNTVSIQKCLRTSDIDEVGDETHLTFFEMLGNFSFGGYWKKEAIEYAHEFITKEMGLTIDYVSIFKGENGVPKDVESAEIWKSIDPSLKIVESGREDNFWGPTGEEGPCGPTTEIYVGGVEIWNLVFNEFYQHKDKTLEPLKTKGVDTGMGLERLAMVVQKKNNIFETDLFSPVLQRINMWNIGTGLHSTSQSGYVLKSKRIIADHIRASVFMFSDGVSVSNKEGGYVLKNIIKRMYEEIDTLNMPSITAVLLADLVVNAYGNSYKEIQVNKGKIEDSIKEEIDKNTEVFNLNDEEIEKTFNKVMKNLGKSPLEVKIQPLSGVYEPANPYINGKEAFLVYSTYGIPKSKIIKFAYKNNYSLKIDEFEEELKKHKEISRVGSEKKFKGGLAGTGEMETKYHTATHLLNASLRKVLGTAVEQRGSNITTERLRYDFSWPQKMTDEEIKKVEDLVNEKINESLNVSFEEVSLGEAREMGALGVFGDKYGERVKVYKVGPDKSGEYFSQEICGGPHVSNTKELGNFKIKKEESSSAGIRRIKAILE